MRIAVWRHDNDTPRTVRSLGPSRTSEHASLSRYKYPIAHGREDLNGSHEFLKPSSRYLLNRRTAITLGTAATASQMRMTRSHDTGPTLVSSAQLCERYSALIPQSTFVSLDDGPFRNSESLYRHHNVLSAFATLFDCPVSISHATRFCPSMHISRFSETYYA